MISNDILSVISEYLDLRSYKLLILESSKIFTLIKYQKYQDEYETYFSNQIIKKLNIFYTHIETNIKDLIKKKYFVLKHLYYLVKILIYALEYCNIFIYSDLIEKLDIVNIENNIFDQVKVCELKGYLTSKINSEYIKDKIIILYKRGFMPHDDSLYIIKNAKILKELKLDILAENNRLLSTYFIIMRRSIDLLLNIGDYDPNIEMSLLHNIIYNPDITKNSNITIPKDLDYILEKNIIYYLECLINFHFCRSYKFFLNVAYRLQTILHVIHPFFHYYNCICILIYHCDTIFHMNHFFFHSYKYIYTIIDYHYTTFQIIHLFFHLYSYLLYII